MYEVTVRFRYAGLPYRLTYGLSEAESRQFSERAAAAESDAEYGERARANLNLDAEPFVFGEVVRVERVAAEAAADGREGPCPCIQTKTEHA
jgi:carotenoid cleavage dioxygenase-like enzyme